MTVTSNAKIAMKTSKNMKNKGNVAPPKDDNNLPLTKPKDREICNLADKEFKIAVLRKQ